MKHALTTLSLGLFAFAAHSEPPADPEIQKISVSREDCQYVVKAAPRDDVAYKPGVDVHGNPVIPAEGPDGNADQIDVPNEIVIDFGLDLAGRYGINGAGLLTAKANVFAIHYDIDAGTLTINGKLLNPGDSQAVTRACALMLSPKGRPY